MGRRLEMGRGRWRRYSRLMHTHLALRGGADRSVKAEHSSTRLVVLSISRVSYSILLLQTPLEVVHYLPKSHDKLQKEYEQAHSPTCQ